MTDFHLALHIPNTLFLSMLTISLYKVRPQQQR